MSHRKTDCYGLTFDLLYSPADGASWLVIMMVLTSTSLTLCGEMPPDLFIMNAVN